MIYRYILDLIDDGLIRKGRALDLGCGPGGASLLLSILGFEVEAVDWKQYDIHTSSECRPVSFIRSDIRTFSIQKNTYDFINARHVLHFLKKEEIQAMIGHMCKGLKKGGVLYFTLSGDKDGWKDISTDVTFLSEGDLVTYVENELEHYGPIHNKITRLGFGTTTHGVRKFSHTISYTVVKS